MRDTLSLPSLPLLVVINTTPFAPLEPYIAVEEASFSTEIFSISDEEMSFKLFTGKPSTMISGEESWLIEVPPRTFRLMVASGEPSVLVTDKPATLPVSASATLATGTFFKSAPFITATEPVRSLF